MSLVHRGREPAARYDAELVDVYDAPNDAPKVTIEIISRRTPGFSGWQQERWLFHCGDGAAFLGPVGASELDAFPDAREMLRFEHSTGGWSPWMASSRPWIRTAPPRPICSKYVVQRSAESQ
ncbi:CbrC family protein [Nonomuraea sp. NPDC049269]|uniref:CbrC family protein n=1 Tax=Nonomuraea sp. NPDC049269 TaxID=3364349 RepID=UPI0037206AA3